MFLRFLVISIFLLPLGLWANEEVQTSVNSNTVQVGEGIILDIFFDPGTSQGEIELSIPGIENFAVFSQSQQQQTQSINGVTQTQFQYTLQLRPQQEGEYVLGPVQINLGNRVLQDDDDIVIQVGNIVKEVQEEGVEETEDIGEIASDKPELRPLRGYEISQAFFILLMVLFFIIFFALLKKYLFPQRPLEQKEISKHILGEKRKFELYFQKLQNVHTDLESQEFSRRLNFGIRKILELEGITIAETATLIELQRNKIFQQHSLKTIFKTSYESEFSSKNVDIQMRTEYIEHVMRHIKNIGK